MLHSIYSTMHSYTKMLTLQVAIRIPGGGIGRKCACTPRDCRVALHRIFRTPRDYFFLILNSYPILFKYGCIYFKKCEDTCNI